MFNLDEKTLLQNVIATYKNDRMLWEDEGDAPETMFILDRMEARLNTEKPLSRQDLIYCSKMLDICCDVSLPQVLTLIKRLDDLANPSEQSLSMA